MAVLQILSSDQNTNQKEYKYFADHPNPKLQRIVDLENRSIIIVSFTKNSKDSEKIGWSLKLRVPKLSKEFPDQKLATMKPIFKAKGKLPEDRVIDDDDVKLWMKSHKLSRAAFEKVSDAIDSIVDEDVALMEIQMQLKQLRH